MKEYIAFILLFPVFIGIVGIILDFATSIKCPKCGSRNVETVWDWKVEECRDCGHEWRP